MMDKAEADVVGIFPNEAGIVRLLGAVLTEQNEEGLLQNRYLPQHSMAETDQTGRRALNLHHFDGPDLSGTLKDAPPILTGEKSTRIQ